MLAEALLHTKVQPPSLRQPLIPRPDLEQKLQQALVVPLTLVSAPAGFGKTTAIAATIQHLAHEPGVVLAWLSLDEQDNEPERFWRYLFAAVETAVALQPSLAGSLTQLQPPPVSLLVTMLINQLAALPQTLLLVLDDLHLVTRTEIHEELSRLLDHAPANLHLILGTRADPPLPLHRLRARRQLLEIRVEELRFNTAETAAFLQQAAPPTLTDEEVMLLFAETEGWVVGLQLAAHALPAGRADQRSFMERMAGSNRFILEYLAEEVLARQSRPVQQFLLQTAVLERLCGPLCDAVTGGDGGEEMLAWLALQNLFLVPFSPDEPATTTLHWYRYHHLFAALLQGALRQQQPELETELQRRAAEWFAGVGDIETAVGHAFAAAEYALVARLVEENASKILMQGQARILESWLQRLPPPTLATLPRANLAFAQTLLLRGQFGRAVPYLQRAETSDLAASDAAFLGEVHALRATLAESVGDAEQALVYARQALNNMADDNLVLQALAHFALAGALRETGDVTAAVAAYDHAIPLCRAARLPLIEVLARAHLCLLCTLRGQLHRVAAIAQPVVAAGLRSPAVAAMYAILGMVYLEWNRLAETEELLDRALALAGESGHRAAAIHCNIVRSRLVRAQGDDAGALQALVEAAALFEEGAPAWLEPLLRSQQVQFWLAQGDVALAAQVVAQSTHQSPQHMQDLLHLAEVRVKLRRGTPADLTVAQSTLDRVLAGAEADGQHGVVIEGRLLRALVHDAQDNDEAAVADLRHALMLAQPEGYLRLFVEAGTPLAQLLARAAHPYAQNVLQAFPTEILEGLTAVSPLAEPLTEREADVLRLMARGLTYKQIATELIVSVNTVRHHVKGLYGKLGVSSRAQAVNEGRRLGLTE